MIFTNEKVFKFSVFKQQHTHTNLHNGDGERIDFSIQQFNANGLHSNETLHPSSETNVCWNFPFVSNMTFHLLCAWNEDRELDNGTMQCIIVLDGKHVQIKPIVPMLKVNAQCDTNHSILNRSADDIVGIVATSHSIHAFW